MIRLGIVAPRALVRAGLSAALARAEVTIIEEAADLDDGDLKFALGELDAVIVDASVLVKWTDGQPVAAASLSAEVGLRVGLRLWREAIGRIDLLSVREREVLGLIGDGLSNHAIACQLDLAERTIKAHVGRILTKLEVESRLQAGLVAIAHRASTG
ncbi:hypothetical protein Aph02nite_09920 [Actinoplanes philippinensis]|uniref:Regulatory protein, luxR family n=1 Tax=Actinoplanes philippinensis TaxID=35752 RepID=A0A1I2A7M5_9ACTN|nr:hypothetical protein Aph02nite_09920 [Actinoplanes philippinensis]SFE39777.1 regulatory protein, luxR family [Actinoplanes philippinensis]